jgi:hypothetical protein
MSLVTYEFVLHGFNEAGRANRYIRRRRVDHAQESDKVGLIETGHGQSSLSD